MSRRARIAPWRLRLAHEQWREVSSGLSRRSFLRAAGVTLALPFLPSALPRQLWAAGNDKPRRLLFWFVPNGMQMNWWTPSSSGSGYDLPEILEPLAPIQDKVSVLTGLANAAAHVSGVPGDHARGTGTFLTCTTLNHSVEDIYNGVSVDQVAAQALGSETQFPSLELGMDSGSPVGDCDNGYSCAYQRNIAWSGPTTPLPKITDPRLLFSRLCAGADPTLTAAEIERRRVLRLSVLDSVYADAQRLQSGLSRSDALKMDEYLHSVRELELRIENLSDSTCVPPPGPPLDLEFSERLAVLTELMVVAMRCDLTRVTTFMHGNGASNRNHSFLGAAGAHHELSHHQGYEENLQKLRIIGRWEVQHFVDLLLAMDSVDEGDGCTLLDNSLLYFGSEIEDGDSHSHSNLPVLLAGGGGGEVLPGRHITYGQQTPVANLFIAMLANFGVLTESFGEDGHEALPAL